ncbi:hypothetical protein PGTUg99_016951 [Puccinia graminis f. sp. tritici]|uniref:No apical meristem-associated C-terminal domain-containing protein n=1 Tax=Puccinia graminis f. sp. tritici TaxID=56615 RepID=A0A5B0RJG8_PUCGR|nr:hypothetical protein PGTUg99_016951 [Puccinia graminis f. sp. tritici]
MQPTSLVSIVQLGIRRQSDSTTLRSMSKLGKAHTLVANEHKHQNDIFDKEAQSLQMMAATGAANNNVMIMNQDLSNLDAYAREYFTLRRKQILASLRGNSGPSS